MGYNKIIYGAPGVGKSFSVNEEVGDNYRFTTTFHPEYTYYDFVGGYKPVVSSVLEENIYHYYDAVSSSVQGVPYSLTREKMAYKFVNGVFLESYIKAWSEYFVHGKEVYLIIEELNRGNCAAIFGEIFQLLDRDEYGASDYFINVNKDIASIIENRLGTPYLAEIMMILDAKRIEKPENLYSVLLLPPNLNIVATMNTSDQSLFPLDSAFKRRWLWKYVPIDYTLFPGREIIINLQHYNWNQFLEIINNVIYKITESEDKCIGPFFVKSNSISKDEFVEKVLFYIWTECFKDETKETLEEYFPKTRKLINGVLPDELISFADFFDATYGENYIIEFMTNLGL
ncbi:AAA family ATPase [Butyrivibrio sp. MB2005]|uniref:AAA family ATPase n=1 Tax=Butyrivibrio sp. MB2005 TaxID=1280678 RepID=UPI0004253FB8|nr:AAA family ATPase [Butyrivibrio sp. MB2005]